MLGEHSREGSVERKYFQGRCPRLERGRGVGLFLIRASVPLYLRDRLRTPRSLPHFWLRPHMAMGRIRHRRVDRIGSGNTGGEDDVDGGPGTGTAPTGVGLESIASVHLEGWWVRAWTSRPGTAGRRQDGWWSLLGWNCFAIWDLCVAEWVDGWMVEPSGMELLCYWDPCLEEWVGGWMASLRIRRGGRLGGRWLLPGRVAVIRASPDGLYSPRGYPPQFENEIRGIGISACLIRDAALSEGCVPGGYEFVAHRPSGGEQKHGFWRCAALFLTDQNRKRACTHADFDVHALSFVYMWRHAFMVWTHVTERRFGE